MNWEIIHREDRDNRIAISIDEELVYEYICPANNEAYRVKHMAEFMLFLLWDKDKEIKEKDKIIYGQSKDIKRLKYESSYLPDYRLLTNQ